MPAILHRIGITNTTLKQTYLALTSQAGLSSWWTSDTLGDGNQIGKHLHFTFGSQAIAIKVLEVKAGQQVLWQVIDGPKEWLGTKIGFEIKEEDEYIILLFKHMDWLDPVEFMHLVLPNGQFS